MGVASLYFIRNLRSGSIKIGISKRPKHRLTKLQTGNEDQLRLELVVPDADRSLEQRLHEDWADYRLCGEWFRTSARLEAYIANLRSSVAIYNSGGLQALLLHRWLTENRLSAWVGPCIRALTQQHSK